MVNIPSIVLRKAQKECHHSESRRHVSDLTVATCLSTRPLNRILLYQTIQQARLSF